MNLKERFVKQLRKFLGIYSPSEEILKLTSVWMEDIKPVPIETKGCFYMLSEADRYTERFPSNATFLNKFTYPRYCFYSVIDDKYVCMIHNADSVHAVHFIGASMLRCKVADPNLDECEVCGR